MPRTPQFGTVLFGTTRFFEGAIILVLSGITLVITDSAVMALTLTDSAVLTLTLTDELAGG